MVLSMRASSLFFLLYGAFQAVNARLLIGNVFAAPAKREDNDSGLVSDSEHPFPGTTLDPNHFQFPEEFTADDHLINNRELPGLPRSYKHKMYAGHVAVSEKTLKNPGALFYWLLESQSDPDNDPLLIWLNGGPGCSSMEGLFGENGAWWISRDGKSLELNEYSWNKHANTLYIDQPVGTGLAVALHGQYTNSQAEVDTMFAVFIHKFLKAYPHYRKRPIWFSGESYAGHYIPYFVTGIKEGRGAFKGLEDLHIGGMMIGNGWSHPLIQTQTWPEYAYNIGLLGWQQRHYLEKLSLDCGVAYAHDPLVNPNPVRIRGNRTTAPWTEEARVVDSDAKAAEARKARKLAVAKEHSLVAGEKNPGRIHSAPLAVEECNKVFEDLLLLSGSAKTGLINVYDVRLYDTTAGDVWPPSQWPMKQYLNQPAVRKAIHAVELFEWAECSGPVNRALGKENMIASRPLIVEAMDEYGIPVLVYNGQFDLICNHVGTEAYLSTMVKYKDLEKFLASRRAVWNVDGEIAGYVKHAEGTALTFLLVLGGSHMAPMDKPKQSYDMIRRFMNGRGFADEQTLVDLPFTPTVPFIPGDVVNDDEDDSKDTKKPPTEESNLKYEDVNAGARPGSSESRETGAVLSSTSASASGPTSSLLPGLFLVTVFAIVSLIALYLYRKPRSHYEVLE